MKKIILLTLLGTLFIFNSYSQTDVDSEIKDFLLEKTKARPEVVSMYAYELLSNKEWDKDAKFGVYRIGTFSSHGWPYLLFIDDGKKYFSDKSIFNLRGSINFLLLCFDNSKYKYTDSEQLAYIKDLISLYNSFYEQYSGMIEERKEPNLSN